MSAYYNEHDPFAAAWLRELIADGLIAEGDVDERDIQTLDPADLAGYTQCHFFAGIGGWSLALRLAGWPDDRPVWTGSCPCQPFSAAGANLGGTDPRHLWPAWYHLIRECRPPVLFGEQVESAVAHGWLDLVCDDMEREGYAIGAVSLPAASVGAPHIRQRLWFVAEEQPAGVYRNEDEGDVELLCNLCHNQPLGGECRCWHGEYLCRDCDEWTYPFYYDLPAGGCQQCGGANLVDPERERRRIGRHERHHATHDESSSPWADYQLAPLYTGGLLPAPGINRILAARVSPIVDFMRGAGNAVVPQVAAAFIAAYQEVNQ